MKFNLNDTVRVRLTSFGKQILRQQFDERHARQPDVFNKFYPPREINGWSEWQMWQLFSTFGEYFRMDNEINPFELTIEIPEQSVLFDNRKDKECTQHKT